MRHVIIPTPRRRWRWAVSGTAAVLLGLGTTGLATAASAATGHPSHPGGFNHKGDILIADQANERVIEVNRAHRIIWQYGMTGVAGSGSDQLNNPNSAELPGNGHILIADESNNRVIEINQHKQIVFSQGKIQVDGNGFNQLNAPYDAKVMGDYTGLTPPSGFKH